jgi:hypothetical protein
MAETTLLRVIATRPGVWGVKNNNRVEYKNYIYPLPREYSEKKFQKRKKEKKKKKKKEKKRKFSIFEQQ